MGRAILIIGAGALAVGVIIYALIECAQSDKYAVRAIPKWGWLLVILLLPVVGAVLWLLFGRPRKNDAAREPQRGRGPDDDPQFLRNLEERRKQQERARKLQEWENELKRTGRAPGERPDAEEPVLDPSDPRLAAPSPDHPADDVRANDPDDAAPRSGSHSEDSDAPRDDPDADGLDPDDPRGDDSRPGGSTPR